MGHGALSLTGDRRIAVFKETKLPNGTVEKKSCAEALPDIAITSDIKSNLNAVANAAGKGEIDVKLVESLEQSFQQVYDRSDKSDLVRQFGWQFCQAYINGGIDEGQYASLLAELVQRSFE